MRGKAKRDELGSNTETVSPAHNFMKSRCLHSGRVSAAAMRSGRAAVVVRSTAVGRLLPWLFLETAGGGSVIECQ